MVYTMPGVYTYHVKELAGTDKTIGYSTQEYDVTVTVTGSYDTTDYHQRRQFAERHRHRSRRL